MFTAHSVPARRSRRSTPLYLERLEDRLTPVGLPPKPADMVVLASGPPSIAPSTQMSVTVTLSNDGPYAAYGVVLTDTVSGISNFGFSITPAPGNPDAFTESVNGGLPIETANAPILSSTNPDTFVCVITPPNNASLGTVITFTATVTANTPDPNPSNNTASVATTIRPAGADMAVAMTGPASILVGAVATYTITLTNNGPDAAAGVVLSDGHSAEGVGQFTFSLTPASTNPDSFTLEYTPDGGSATETANGSIAPGNVDVFVATFGPAVTPFPLGTVIGDGASVTATTSDPDSSNNSASVSTTVAPPTADMSVIETGPTSILTGTAATYTLTLTNNGPFAAAGVVLSDTTSGIPFSGSYTPAASNPDSFTLSIANGGSTAVETANGPIASGNVDVFVAVIAPTGTVPIGTVIRNSATVTAITSDPDSANNTASVNTTITSPTATWLGTDIAGASNDGTQLLWTTPGESAIWSITSSGSGTSGPVYGSFAGWSAVADASGSDGNTRILWTNTNGAAALWIVNAAGTIQQTAVFGPFSGWTATDLAVGSDNNARILWTNTNGAAVVWDLTGPSLTVVPGTIFDPGGGWVARKLAAGSDGLLRLLWTNPSGASAIYTLSATGALETAGVYGAIAGWTPVAIAVGSDDQLRIFWDNSSGAVAIWDVNSSYSVTAATVYGPFAGWVGEGLAAEPDGMLRLLWDNASGAASLWDLTASAGFISASVFGPVPVGGS